MRTVFFINSTEEICGIHQFGKRTYDNIKDSVKYTFLYFKVPSQEYLSDQISKYKPEAIIYNFYPCTMPWLDHTFLNRYRKSFPQLSLLFEVPITGFDYLINPDPIYKDTDNIFRVGRPLAKFSGNYPKNDRINIGSFGFAFGWKSFPRMVRLVNEQFDDAVINLQIPFATFGDKDGDQAKRVANECRTLITKPKIDLNITHEFLDQDDILQFIANNDINVFVANPEWEFKPGEKISTDLPNFVPSVPDMALSVKRPFAISKINIMRHIISYEDSICVENNSIKTILDNGTKPLEKFYEMFSQKNLVKDYERILDTILGKESNV